MKHILWCCKLIFIFKSLLCGRGNLPEIQKTLTDHTAKHYSIKEFNRETTTGTAASSFKAGIRCTKGVKYVAISSELPKSKVGGTNQSVCTMQLWKCEIRLVDDGEFSGHWMIACAWTPTMGNDLAKATTDICNHVAWLGVAEWIKPEGEMFVFA